jgi:hypothetical protein
MSESTVKARLTAKRPKQVRENPEYAAFTRRILAAYGRRVAAGDIEALPAMLALSTQVDATLKVAVRGLHGFGYSWTDIANRLGVSRQAAQMRYGDTADRGALDPRLRDGGLGIALGDLVAVYVDHHPGTPRPAVCPECSYRYPNGVRYCPTLSTVRPILLRRRSENPAALDRLTSDQLVDLHDRKAAQADRTAVLHADDLVADDPNLLSLFDLSGGEAR